MNLDDLDMYQRSEVLDAAADNKKVNHYTNAQDVHVRVVKGETSVFIEGRKVFSVTTRNPTHVELGTL